MGGAMLSPFYRNGSGWFQRHGTEVGTALVAVVFLAVAVHILRELDISTSSMEGITIICCASVALAVTFPAHGLAPAALILIIGFAGGNRILFGLGLLALASFISHYYYQMHETLLVKSLILGQIGILLLAGRWVLRKLFPAREARLHA
jgi:uncharacterized membrane protein